MSDLDKLKQLREETGVSYAICKKALDEAEGNVEKARDILKSKGAEVAKKKAERATNQGSIFSYIHHNTKIGTLVVLLCETDFVAKNDSFKELGKGIAMQIATVNPENRDELLASDYFQDSSKTIDELIKEQVLKLGENITLGEYVRYEI